jgi:hypothetical protein
MTPATAKELNHFLLRNPIESLPRMRRHPPRESHSGAQEPPLDPPSGATVLQPPGVARLIHPQERQAWAASLNGAQGCLVHPSSGAQGRLIHP